MKEELPKERATLTNIELMISDIAKRHTWTGMEIPQKERLVRDLARGDEDIDLSNKMA